MLCNAELTGSGNMVSDHVEEDLVSLRSLNLWVYKQGIHHLG